MSIDGIKSIHFKSLKFMELYKAEYAPMSMITNNLSILNIGKLANKNNYDSNNVYSVYTVYTPSSDSMFLNAIAISIETIR